jgi:hypothetical protein
MNLAPHATLTHYGPGFKVSPTMVHEDPELELYINRRISQENAITTHQQDYALTGGEIVCVYNPAAKMGKRRMRVRDQPYKIVNYDRGMYQLEGLNGECMIAPRTMIRRLRRKEIELLRSKGIEVDE